MSSKEPKIIDVSMAEMKTAKNNVVLCSSGIGSCIIITLYDPVHKIGAMAHPILPQKNSDTIDNPARYVDSAISEMLKVLKKQGLIKLSLEAKIVGGADMFRVLGNNPQSIGAKNVKAAVSKLEKEGIKIVATDTGENCGRSVAFDLKTGLLEVKTRI